MLDLTLDRIRQITAAIMRRHAADQFRHRRLLSWQTQTLAWYTANTLMTDGKGNKLAELALKVDIDNIDPASMPKPKKVMPKENAPGTYEALMGGPGAMMRSRHG